MVDTRKCGECTKCCEGYLKTTIRGQEVSPGKPCFLLQIGKGCIDYDNRPQDPCREFNCEWLVNPEIPDFFQPSISQVVVHEQYIEKIYYLRMSYAGKMPTDEMIEFFKSYGIKNKINICWVDSTGEKWLGDIIFEEAMNRRKLMNDQLKSYLMNCDLEDLSDATVEKYSQIAKERMNSEKYWRDRISAENQ